MEKKEKFAGRLFKRVASLFDGVVNYYKWLVLLIVTTLNKRNLETLKPATTTVTGLENYLLTIGLSNDNQLCQDMYCIRLQLSSCTRRSLTPYRNSLNRSNNVTKSTRAIPTTVYSQSAACAFNHTVYVIGIGGDPHKQTWKWNAETGWLRCGDMITGRWHHCVTVADSTVYTLGGRVEVDSETLSSVESYNTTADKWSSAGRLVHAVSNAACVTYKNSIYVFGGIDKEYDVVNHVQVYNRARKSCTLMDEPMTRAYINMRAVLWETSVILLGRWTCLIYNFETRIWQERAQFKTGVNYFASTLDKSTVYIAGGSRYKKGRNNQVMSTCTYFDEFKSVSVLDIIRNKPAVWHHHHVLPQRGNANVNLLITLPS